MTRTRRTPDCRRRVRTSHILLGLPLAFLMGCAPSPPVQRVTPTPPFVTATLPAMPVPLLKAIPGTGTSTSTSTPLIGTTTTRLNVRAEPLSSSSPLGLISASASVQILGKDPSGNWYQIVYEGPAAGVGWVASEYVKVQDKDAIAVVGGRDSEPTASVREQINVRSGPGTSFDTLGTLNPRDVVTLTGKDSIGSWLQIKFAAGPGGRGWVAASFLDATAIDKLPIVAESGEVIGTSTPTGVPPTPIPTIVAALDDGDSVDAPAVDVEFSPSGVGSIFFSSDVSAPQGDAADWVNFTPYYATVTISLACNGNGQLTAQLHQAGDVVGEAEADVLACGATKQLTLVAGHAYALKLTTAADSSELAYVRYTVSIYGVVSH